MEDKQKEITFYVNEVEVKIIVTLSTEIGFYEGRFKRGSIDVRLSNLNGNLFYLGKSEELIEDIKADLYKGLFEHTGIDEEQYRKVEEYLIAFIEAYGIDTGEIVDVLFKKIEEDRQLIELKEKYMFKLKRKTSKENIEELQNLIIQVWNSRNISELLDLNIERILRDQKDKHVDNSTC
jgi:hypothetical protein